MALVAKRTYLPGETAQAVVRPHPLSFLGAYTIALTPALIMLGLYIWSGTSHWNSGSSGAWYTYFWGNNPTIYTYAYVATLLVGIGVAVASIRWRIAFQYLAALLTGTALDIVNDGWAPRTNLLLGISAVSILLLIATEINRRQHKYTITNFRLIFKGGLFVSRERQLRFESISDIEIEQSPLGALFGYGTIIPITKSGYGLGEDTSQAGIAAGIGGEAGKGVKGKLGIGAFAAGGKGVQTARARSHAQLQGVRPLRDLQNLVELTLHQNSQAPMMQEQVSLTRDLLTAVQGKPLIPDTGYRAPHHYGESPKR